MGNKGSKPVQNKSKKNRIVEVNLVVMGSGGVGLKKLFFYLN